MKLFCSLVLLGFMVIGCGSSYDNKSLHCGVYTTQPTCPASCKWSGTDCVDYSECSEIRSRSVCETTTIAKKSCDWNVDEATACALKQPPSCTFSMKGDFCCAGTDTNCTAMDANCEFVAPKTCNVKASPTCTFDLKTRYCCSGGAGATCSSDNANCVFNSASTTCS